MINEITGLINRTDELEKYLERFEKQQTRYSKKNVCLDFSRNFSNLEIVLPKKILVATLSVGQGSSVFFQGIVDFSASASETVEFSLVVNDIAIYKAKKSVQSGSNQISIMSSFVPLSSEEINVYVVITPQNQKQLLLSMTTLFVWGDFEKTQDYEYEVIETSDKYLITILNNDIIYYKLASKVIGEYSFSDFSYFAPAIDYSIIYDSVNEKVVIFRIDKQGNLFYSNFPSGNETFVTSGAVKVSAAINSISGKILVAILTKNACKYFEFDSSGELSLLRDLKCGNLLFSDCYVFYNSYRQKFCVVLTTDNSNNFYVEQIDETEQDIENISATYSIDVTLVNSVS